MSADTAAPTRFTLRDLPVPAKVVITCFLLSVGLGYTAAMVQLHFQDSKSGKPMPGVDDVVLKFTGKKKFDTEPPKPVSKFVKLIVTSSGPFNGSGTMLPAFTTKDGGELAADVKKAPALEPQLRAQRDGERDALVLWANAPAEERKLAYDNDHFVPEAGKEPKTLTARFRLADGLKVKSVVEQRCARCHKKGGDAESYPLETYEQIEKYLSPPVSVPFKPGDYVKVEEPIGLEKLTQSTHAHLLSFAVLFSLTGLVFAFTSYPGVVRCVLGPWVLLAIVTDVAFWWLARLSDQYGVYFAMGIIGTGGAAGLGLGAQITLSLWNMYGGKGKFVILLLFAGGGAAMGLFAMKVVYPAWEKKQEDIKQAKADAEKALPRNDDKKDPIPPATLLSKLDRVLLFPAKGPDGQEIPVAKIEWKKDTDGGMVRAFFDKDSGDYAAALKANDLEAQKKLIPERHGELAALTAWAKLPEVERKKAFEADAFPLPSDTLKKPITASYLTKDKTGVKVQSILTDRCVRCHADEEKALFDNYESLRKYLEPIAPKK